MRHMVPQNVSRVTVVCRHHFALHFWQMSHTITVRLNSDLAEWLEREATKTGVSQGKIIRDQLERARAAASAQAFMRLAGVVRGGARDVSMRKGFSRT